VKYNDPKPKPVVRTDKGLDHYLIDVAYNRHCDKMIRLGVYKIAPTVSSIQLDPDFFPYVNKMIAKGLL